MAMYTRQSKVAMFSYLMTLGETLSKIKEFEDNTVFIDMCISLNNARKELVKQYANVKCGEGTVNGKFYCLELANTGGNPFKAKIKMVKANMKSFLKKLYPWMRIAFESDGEVFLVLNKDLEIDLSKF